MCKHLSGGMRAASVCEHVNTGDFAQGEISGHVLISAGQK